MAHADEFRERSPLASYASDGFRQTASGAAKHPEVTFIGQAQTWWGNVDLHHNREQVWPEPSGPVTPGGITERLLTVYPKMYGRPLRPFWLEPAAPRPKTMPATSWNGIRTSCCSVQIAFTKAVLEHLRYALAYGAPRIVSVLHT